MEYNCDSLLQINNERALTVASDRDLQVASDSKEDMKIPFKWRFGRQGKEMPSTSWYNYHDFIQGNY